jgi:hypothetical protein
LFRIKDKQQKSAVKRSEMKQNKRRIKICEAKLSEKTYLEAKQKSEAKSNQIFVY